MDAKTQPHELPQGLQGASTQRSADVTALAATLRSRSSLTLMVGAGVSAVAPTRLPDAVTWLSGLLALLAGRLEGSGEGPPYAYFLRREGLRIEQLGAALTYGRRLAVPLEALLQAINDVRPGLGDHLASAVDRGSRPVNDLHRLAATALADGAVVVTTNFDTCIERAYAALTGAPCPRLVARDAAGAGERLIKVHGSADLPMTLRHTLRTVNQELEPMVAEAVAHAWRRDTVVLGWAGADFDVLRAVRAQAPSGPLWWLDRAPFTAGSVTRRLNWKREVHEVQGDFATLLRHLGGDGTYAATWESIADVSERAIAELPLDAAYRIISTVVYQAAVAEAGLTPFVDALLSFASAHRRRLGASNVRALRGAWDQHVGGRRLLSGAVHLALSRPVPPLRNVALSLSDANEQLERLFGGFFVPARVTGLLVHAGALAVVRRRPPDRATTLGRIELPLLWQRLARSAAGLGARRTERTWLERGLACSDGDPWYETNIRKRLALAKAKSGDPTWRQELVRARECCEFASRRQELADTYRAEAACLWFAGDSIGAERALSRSDTVASPGSSTTGGRRNRLLRVLLSRAPRFVTRAVLWFT